MSETLDLLHKRRSVVALNMTEPGPTKDDLEAILRAGMRVPDHGKLSPWRFVIIEGDARLTLGRVLADVFRAGNSGIEQERVEFEAARFARAPVVVCVVSRAQEHAKIPQWEQVLSAGAVCQNMLVAASALGYASQWLTEWYAYDATVQKALGLDGGEKVAGFIYLGTAKEAPQERVRPEFDDVVQHWKDPAAS